MGTGQAQLSQAPLASHRAEGRRGAPGEIPEDSQQKTQGFSTPPTPPDTHQKATRTAEQSLHLPYRPRQ
eukprot:8124932-Pyramimonas_sp.AAC.1